MSAASLSKPAKLTSPEFQATPTAKCRRDCGAVQQEGTGARLKDASDQLRRQREGNPEPFQNNARAVGASAPLANTRKTLSDEKVELKVKQDSDPLPTGPGQMTPFIVQPMVKVGNEWRLGGSTRSYKEACEQDGQIQAFTPQFQLNGVQ